MIYVKTKHPKSLHNINMQHNKYDNNDFDVETIFFPGKYKFFHVLYGTCLNCQWMIGSMLFVRYLPLFPPFSYKVDKDKADL